MPPPPQAPLPSHGVLKGLRVIVVEDRPDHLEMVRRVLVAAGAQVRGLTSGQEAYDEVHADPPDVMIADLSLRDVSGLTLVRRVRALPGAARLAIIAFTADATPATRRQALDSGVEYYVVKPDIERLLHVLAHATGRTA